MSNVESLQKEVEDLKRQVQMLKNKHFNAVQDRDELIDLAFSLFESVEDSDSDELAKTCYRLVSRYDFDEELLPESLHENVMHLKAEDAKESYFDGLAEDKLWDQMNSGNFLGIANTLYS